MSANVGSAYVKIEADTSAFGVSLARGMAEQYRLMADFLDARADALESEAGAKP